MTDRDFTQQFLFPEPEVVLNPFDTALLAERDRVLEWARQELAELRQAIDEAEKITDTVEAFHTWHALCQRSLRCQNKIAEIKLRCTRRMGQLEKEIKAAKQQNQRKQWL